MVIRAGRHDWTVEARERETRLADVDFFDVTFRRVDEDADEVSLEWAAGFDGLDADLARRLFELAGRRHWRDRRTGRRWGVDLMPTGTDEELEGPIRVRFHLPEGPSASTVYPLGRPLGLATEPELQAMLDVALETRRPRPDPARRWSLGAGASRRVQ